jgi:phosphate transport system protein
MGTGSAIRKTFHQELEELEGEVLRVAARVNEAVARAVEALLDGDLGLAAMVIDDDVLVDQACVTNEERIYALLARQQPTASDLRQVLTAVRVLHELERSGDLAVHVARAVSRIRLYDLTPRVRGLVARMSDSARRLLAVAVDAYAERDREAATSLSGLDDEVDALHVSLLGELFAGGLPLDLTVELALIGRYLERIADHAVVIGDRIAYLVSGELP